MHALECCLAVALSAVSAFAGERRPVVAIADIEIMLNVSYGTARRRLKEMRIALGLPSRGKITLSQARNFFL